MRRHKPPAADPERQDHRVGAANHQKVAVPTPKNRDVSARAFEVASGFAGGDHRRDAKLRTDVEAGTGCAGQARRPDTAVKPRRLGALSRIIRGADNRYEVGSAVLNQRHHSRCKSLSPLTNATVVLEFAPILFDRDAIFGRGFHMEIGTSRITAKPTSSKSNCSAQT